MEGRLDPTVELALRTWAKGAGVASLLRLLKVLQEEARRHNLVLEYQVHYGTVPPPPPGAQS